MLELILMRHAKTEPASPGVIDRKRELTSRGQSDARLAGHKIRSEDWLPDRILCSPAVRTRQTLDALIGVFGTRPTIEFVDTLYGAGTPDYFDAIATAGGDAKRLLVIGHNPTIHLTARAAAASGDKRLRNRLAEKFPTAALALITFDMAGWADARHTTGRLTAVVTPRDLGSAAGD